MHTPNTDTVERRRALAEKVECLLPEDMRDLCGGITAGTEEAWNKRGTGPPSVLIGKQRLYPVREFKTWLQGRVRDRSASHHVSAL